MFVFDGHILQRWLQLGSNIKNGLPEKWSQMKK